MSLVSASASTGSTEVKTFKNVQKHLRQCYILVLKRADVE